MMSIDWDVNFSIFYFVHSNGASILHVRVHMKLRDNSTKIKHDLMRNVSDERDEQNLVSVYSNSFK